MAKQSSFGVCQACGARKGKAAMVAHVQDCMPGHVGAGSSRVPEPLLLLRAEARGLPTFWLDVAVKREGKLKDVDRFLRRIWLECCGHMSEFSTGTHHKVSMNTKVSEALGPGDRLGYVYDFGSVPSSWSACWVASALHPRTPSDSPLAMSRRRGPVMRAGKPRQRCVRSACTKVRGSAALRMHQITIVVRRCCCRWSIHHGWASVGTPVRPNSNWSREWAGSGCRRGEDRSSRSIRRVAYAQVSVEASAGLGNERCLRHPICTLVACGSNRCGRARSRVRRSSC